MTLRTANLPADPGDAGPRFNQQQPQRNAGGTMRFAHKTGERPLDGYKINRGVGAGGFGEVYLAVSDAGKEVALKRVQRNLEIEVRGVSQCLNLKHPNLVDLYDVKYDDQGQAWVVMEYIAGESLKEVIDRYPQGMPQDQALTWFRQIGAGVAYLHGQGIVHRDLKPGNIFDDRGLVKIGDYGLSKLISASRRSGQTQSVGTFHYMAPEIGRGVYGKGIDIYALGILLYEMLTGQVPFDGETSQEIIMKHLTDNPDVTAVPEPFRAIIQRALRKDPDKRFANVQQMIDAIEDAVCDGDPVRVLEATAIDRKDPIYIGDDGPPDADMVFGPLQQHPVVVAQVVSPKQGSGQRRPGEDRGWRPPAGSTSESRPLTVRDLARLAASNKLLVAVLLLVMVVVRPELIPLLILCALGWAGYQLFRALFWRYPPQGNASVALRRDDPRWHKEMRRMLSRKLVSERVAELSGSMLAAAVVAGGLMLVALLLEGQTLDGSVAGWAVFAWLTVTSVIGAWMILTLGKLWESSEGDQAARRLTMLLAGLALGLVAFATAHWLMVQPVNHDDWTARVFSDDQLTGWWFSAGGQPLIAAYMVYFGGLFVLLRWWRQTDPLRKTRLSWATTAMCVFWAWILTMFLPFPQPWGYLLAATISVAVQCSAPWINEKKTVLVAEAKP